MSSSFKLFQAVSSNTSLQKDAGAVFVEKRVVGGRRGWFIGVILKKVLDFFVLSRHESSKNIHVEPRDL